MQLVSFTNKQTEPVRNDAMESKVTNQEKCASARRRESLNILEVKRGLESSDRGELIGRNFFKISLGSAQNNITRKALA